MLLKTIVSSSCVCIKFHTRILTIPFILKRIFNLLKWSAFIDNQKDHVKMTLTHGVTSNEDENRYPGVETGEDCASTSDDVVDNNVAASSTHLSFHRRCGELITLSSTANPSSNSSSSFLSDAGRRYWRILNYNWQSIISR